MERSEQIGELMTALALAQNEFTKLLKDSDNPFYNSKYADLASVIEAVRPALNKQGIAIMHTLDSDLERMAASATLWLFKGEQFISYSVEAPAVGKAKDGKDKFDVQTLGAGWTYLRRYTMQAIGLASEDDDGNSLSSTEAKPVQKKEPAPSKLKQELKQSLETETQKIVPLPGFSVIGDRVNCTPLEVHTKETKGGKPYVFVMLDGPVEGNGVAYCYDRKLFDALKTSKDQLCQFLYRRDPKNGYLYINDVLNVGGEEYHEGVPVNAETTEPLVTSADIPF